MIATNVPLRKANGLAEHALMGVSLANRAFTKKFGGRLCDWVLARDIGCLRVVIFDEIEAINYVVFRGMTQQAARAAARQRGHDFERMFNRLFVGRGLGFSVELESESVTRNHPLYESVLAELLAAYRRNESFAEDVRTQVLTNLSARIEHYGLERIESAMPWFVEYVLKEIAFLELWFRLTLDTLELYPGPNLVVKERLWRGEYPELPGFKRFEGERRFLDVSFLKLDNRNAVSRGSGTNVVKGWPRERRTNTPRRKK